MGQEIEKCSVNLAHAACTGQLHTMNTPDINTEVEWMIQENQGATVDEIAGILVKAQHLHFIYNMWQY